MLNTVPRSSRLDRMRLERSVLHTVRLSVRLRHLPHGFLLDVAYEANKLLNPRSFLSSGLASNDCMGIVDTGSTNRYIILNDLC